MSRFSGASYYVDANAAPPLSIETSALRNKTMATQPPTAPLDAYTQGVPPSAPMDTGAYGVPQSYGAQPNAGGATSPFMQNVPDAAQNGTGGSSAFPAQYGGIGGNADPYAFSSQASSFPPGSALNTNYQAPYLPLSPTYSDPYAPGGALATPASANATLAPAAQTLSSTNMKKYPGSMAELHKNAPRAPAPRALPKWVKWLSIAALVAIIGAIIYRLAKGANVPSPPPPPPPSPTTCPPVACPPTHAPPVAPCPDTEMVVRLSKGEPTLKVEIVDRAHHNHHGKHGETESDDNSKRPATQEHHGRNPAVVIVNEVPPFQNHPEVVPVVTPADPWGLTYAGSGTALPRISDTNMVYTQIGGSL